MKPYRTLTAATLILLPSLLFTGPGYSTSELPAIDAAALREGQPSCPTENPAGCGGLAGASPLLGQVFGRADRFRRERIETCLQFMQRLRGFGGPG